MRRGRASKLEKESGSYFFWDTWKGSEVCKCTYAAKGLWIDVLAVMAGENPRGVIVGNLEALAEALGFGAMAEMWVAQNEHLVLELERKNVFSRGEDIDESLPPDAIVNRRMYREYCKSVDLSEERRRAANIRWQGHKSGPSGDALMETIKAEMECKTSIGDAKEKAPGEAQAIANSGVIVGDKAKSECKTVLSPTQLNPTQSNQPNGVHAPAQVGDCLDAAMRPVNGKEIYDRLIAITRDRGVRARWWNAVVNAFWRAGHIVSLDEHCLYAEGERGSGIKSPSRYMVKRVLASARELGIKVPDVPAEGRS